MEEEESREELAIRVKRSLNEIFGQFEEFNEKVGKSQLKNGLIRAQMRNRTSPSTGFSMNASPNHVPVHIALQSMKNLVEEPLTNLPATLPGIKNARKNHHHNNTPSSSVTNEEDIQRRKRIERENEDGERHKRTKYEQEQNGASTSTATAVVTTTTSSGKKRKENNGTVREKEGSTSGMSPDSGVHSHSTENDLDNENHSAEQILNIMTSLDEPKISPIPMDFLDRARRREQEREEDEKRRKAEEKRKTEEAEMRKLEEEKKQRRMIEEEEKRRKKEEEEERRRKEKEEEERKERMRMENEKRKKKEEEEKRRKKEDEERREKERMMAKKSRKVEVPPSIVKEKNSSASSSISSSPCRSSIDTPPPTRDSHTVPTISVNDIPSSSSRHRNGEIKLKSLKQEKIDKLIRIAKQNGKYVDDEKKNDDKERRRDDDERRKRKEREKREEKERMERKKEKEEKRKSKDHGKDSQSSRSRAKSPTPITPSSKSSRNPEESSKKSSMMSTRMASNKKVAQLAKEASLTPKQPPSVPPKLTPEHLKPSASLKPSTPMTGGASAKNTPLANVSRPSSSMSMNHDANMSGLVATLTPRDGESRGSSVLKQTPPMFNQSMASTSSTHSGMTATTQFRCAWKHSVVQQMKRIQLPDPCGPNPITKRQHYHELAKFHKSKADRCNQRILKTLDYIVASLYFILETISKYEKDRTPAGITGFLSVYKETYEMLRGVVQQSLRDSDDPVVMHMLPRIKVLTLTLLSVMNYQMYMVKSESAQKYAKTLDGREVREHMVPGTSTNNTNNKVLTTISLNNSTSGASTPSRDTFVASLVAQNNETATQPMGIYTALLAQIRYTQPLVFASKMWEDSKQLCTHIGYDFIRDIEAVCQKPISMDSSFEFTANFVLTAVESLKAEYREEQQAAIKPSVTKMKSILDKAIKVGDFIQLPIDKAPPSRPRSAATPHPPNPPSIVAPNNRQPPPS